MSSHIEMIGTSVVASLGVIVGMWLERFLIIVPSLGHKHLPYSFGSYRPQPVEFIIAGATFAAMTLLYVLFAKCTHSRFQPLGPPDDARIKA